jgi:predicted 3-demethylubiquinone-9 3-methyltransferase (glyoxalase superfamily)
VADWGDLAVRCQVDEMRAKLSAGGEEGQCGWLKDRFGLSWQVVPSAVPRLLQDPDPEKSKRVMLAVFQMRKIDIARLEQAYAGE